MYTIWYFKRTVVYTSRNSGKKRGSAIKCPAGLFWSVGGYSAHHNYRQLTKENLLLTWNIFSPAILCLVLIRLSSFVSYVREKKDGRSERTTTWRTGERYMAEEKRFTIVDYIASIVFYISILVYGFIFNLYVYI